MNRCDICLEETCNGKYNCDCSSCAKIKDCYRFLRPTIRITTKCTQECSHCCFSCSPLRSDMMTLEKAQDVARFITSNDIFYANVMGGEFFLNPDWYEIMRCFMACCKQTRLVTSGDWVGMPNVCERLNQLKEEFSDGHNPLAIAISNDRWHSNTNVEEAERFLIKNNFDFTIGENGNSLDHIVPIGRGDSVSNMYGMFSCYCHNPSKMYSFLIDEIGSVFKCSFGVWKYADIVDYLDGGFYIKFKDFNKRFYDIFVPSCSSCVMQYKLRESKQLIK